MESQIIFKIYEKLPRQGPGNYECTSRAFRLIPELTENAVILDIGCGKGEETLSLARLCRECMIIALDIYQPYLDALEEKAVREGFSGRIKTVCGSMYELPFEEDAFDIIWAESSIFVMGFGKALKYWKNFLKPKGYIVATDAVWFTESPSDEAASFWREEYPDMKTENENVGIIKSEGYLLIDSFRLPDSVWWQSYYDYLDKSLEDLKKEFKGDDEAEPYILLSEKEMETFRKYSGEYGITFFIMQKSQ